MTPMEFHKPLLLALLLGGVVFVGLFNLVFYKRRRQLKAHYYYGMLCIFYFVWNVNSLAVFDMFLSSFLNSHYKLIIVSISANRTLFYFLLYIMHTLEIRKPIYEKTLRIGANLLLGACFFMPFSISYTIFLNQVVVLFNILIPFYLFPEMLKKAKELYKDVRIILVMTYLLLCMLAMFKVFNLPFVDQTMILAVIMMVLQSIVIAKQYNVALMKVERANEILEQTVAERTAELVQKGTETTHLILSISHDLRTPISVVGGYMELLQSDPTINETNQQYIASSVVRLSQMERLTLDLFTLAQLNNESYTFLFEKVNIEEEIQRIADLYQKQAEQKGITLQIDTTPAECIADQMRVMQVLDNLMMNALSYARSTITISTITNDTEVQIIVADDGLGINQDELPFVFDRFYKKRQRGSGIGLSNVKELVQRMKGEVFVESIPLISTRFIFTLPRKQ